MVLRVTVNGKTQSLAAHCRDLNKSYQIVHARIYQHKWSIKQALGLSPPPRDSINRIIDKIEIDPVTRCWEWTGHLNQEYGQISINYKNILVHRFIYQYIHGKNSSDKPFVLHQCDNPKCCNPMHLYAGTKKDNAIDRSKRNPKSYQIGEKHGLSKLTEKQVLEIRASKDPQRVIAKRFKVSETNIRYIKNRKTWRHI